MKSYWRCTQPCLNRNENILHRKCSRQLLGFLFSSFITQFELFTYCIYRQSKVMEQSLSTVPSGTTLLFFFPLDSPLTLLNLPDRVIWCVVQL